jgi:hypothetical protein
LGGTRRKRAGPEGPTLSDPSSGALDPYSKRRRVRFVTNAPASTGRNERVSHTAAVIRITTVPIVPQLVPRATSASAIAPIMNSIVRSFPRDRAVARWVVLPCSSRLPTEGLGVAGAA